MTEEVNIESCEEMIEPKLTYKAILLGSTGVGKTCVMLRASKDTFNEEHNVTLGADFANFFFKINGTTAKLQLWDTCGLEVYKSMITVFFKGSDGAFLVFDLTNQKTFDDTTSWLNDLREYTSSDLVCYLIGNKSDLTKKVSKNDIDKMVKDNNLNAYYETSAKSEIGRAHV